MKKVKNAKSKKTAKPKVTAKPKKETKLNAKAKACKACAPKAKKIEKIPPKAAKIAKTAAPVDKKVKTLTPPPAKVKTPAPSHCQFPHCKLPATTDNYCRLHYMMAFQATLLSNKKDAQGKLKGMFQELSSKYPDEYMELLRNDLVSEETFRQAVTEMDVNSEESEFEFDDFKRSKDDE